MFENDAPSSVRSQLERVLASKGFGRSEALSRFLHFVVEETLAGRAGLIKEYVVGLEVFGRGDAFDPKIDPIVRVQARKLRARLEEYYRTDGHGDPVRIELPRGGYVPTFTPRGDPPTETSPALPYTDSPAMPAPVTPARRWTLTIVCAAIGLAAAVALLAWRMRPSEAPPARAGPVQVTFDIGWSGHPTISRDGTIIAYSSDRGEGGSADIWAQSLEERGAPVQLTRHPAHETTPHLSPDGTRVAFRSNRDGGGIYVVSLLTGSERALTSGGYSPRFSPDGRWIAYTAINPSGAQSLFVVPASGGEPREMLAAPRNVWWPLWTPDGRYLLYRDAVDDREEHYDWWGVGVDLDSPSRRPAFRVGFADALARAGRPDQSTWARPGDWAGHDMVFAAGRAIWKVPFSPRTWTVAGQPVEVLTWPGSSDPQIGGQGPQMLAFSSGSWVNHVWSLPVDPDRGASIGQILQLTRDSSLVTGLPYVSPRLSANGRVLVFVTGRAGNQDIWLKDLTTGNERAVTATPLPEDWPLVNQDGSGVVFRRMEDGRAAIYIARQGRQPAMRVCDDCGQPKDWSADETRILYVAGRSLMSLDTATGRKDVLLHSDTHVPMEAEFSPDGHWIALTLNTVGRDRITGVLVPFQDRLAGEHAWIPVTEEIYHLSLHWSPSGTLIYYFSTRDDFRCIWAQRLDPVSKRPTGSPFAVHHLHQYQAHALRGSWISLAQDKLAVTLSNPLANTWVWSAPTEP